MGCRHHIKCIAPNELATFYEEMTPEQYHPNSQFLT